MPVMLAYRPTRGRCKRCGIKVEAMPWSRGKSPLSLPLIIVLATYARILAWEGVARLTGVHWNTVKAAVKSAVDFGLAHRDTASVIAVGIDGISRRKGHKYMTMVYDLSGMRLLWCGEGRDKEALRAFLRDWGEERRGAIEAVDGVRREEARRLKEEGQAELLSGTRYIFLKNLENLTGGQRARLSDLEKLNLKINHAYLLKEAFRSFWGYTYPRNAEKYLDRWLGGAACSRLEPMRDFARMIKRHKERILNYFRMPITNASVEGMNRKAKVISQRAYGSRTVGTFQLALYHALGDLPMLEMTHRFL